MRELFLGRLPLALIHPYPSPVPERPEFAAFYQRFKSFLREQVDPVEIDASGACPAAVLDALKRLGAFGMKIPVAYGGLGFSQHEYNRIMQLLGGHERGLAVMLAVSQAVGLPQPLRLFGTAEQQRRYLPRCAAGAISGFALTETGVGSDPAALATRVEPAADGYLLNGEKLWISNGPLAELLVVAARHADSGRISAFIVETAWPGVRLEHRCEFMGLRGEANGVIGFTDVHVPRANLLGAEGQGLKIALVTLNGGRLSLPAIAVGMAQQCLEVTRKWGAVRHQWGRPIGRHQANAHKLATMAATVFGMDTLADFAARMADRDDYDIRLEAATAKEWNTTQVWQVIDDALQIRGGRGYETERSLAARGEAAIGIERLLRDARIMRIFEGASEIMHLLIAREAVDWHLQIAGVLADPAQSFRARLAAAPRIVAHYLLWYPGRWLAWDYWPRYREFGALAPSLRFVARAGRRLARALFHGMLVHRARLPEQQAFLFRLVDIGMALTVMALCISRARRLGAADPEHARQAEELAALFCRDQRRTIARRFRALSRNDDAGKDRIAERALAGELDWLERGTMELGLDAAQLRVESVAEKLAARRPPGAERASDAHARR